MAEKTAAVLTIQKPGQMSQFGRYEIAEWLRKQADAFESMGHQYSNHRFRARYIHLYPEKEEVDVASS